MNERYYSLLYCITLYHTILHYMNYIIPYGIIFSQLQLIPNCCNNYHMYLLATLTGTPKNARHTNHETYHESRCLLGAPCQDSAGADDGLWMLFPGASSGRGTSTTCSLPRHPQCRRAPESQEACCHECGPGLRPRLWNVMVLFAGH